MSNPYQSPGFDPQHFQDAPFPTPQVDQSGFAWVSQVRIVAVLNCVQGGFEIAMGLMFIGMAFLVPQLLATQQAAGAAAPPPQVMGILPWVYGGIGGPILLSGILRLYAGVRNFQFRDRILGIVSLVLGVVSMFGCYCGPTSIALLVYGLIVYLNPAVATAFEMGKQGMNGAAILATFAAGKSPTTA